MTCPGPTWLWLDTAPAPERAPLDRDLEDLERRPAPERPRARAG